MASLSSQQPSKTTMRTGGGSNTSRGNRNSGGQTVKFARRTSSGRYVSLSREDVDMSGEILGDYMNYSVHLPPTPDNQPMDSEVSHPQMAGDKVTACSMPTCDGTVMKDERGANVIPCDCRDCYIDAQRENGLCPDSKEPCKVRDYEDDAPDFSSRELQLSAPDSLKRDANNMSMMKRNQMGEFDNNPWLFETKGTYGVGNAFWPQDDTYGHEEDERFEGDMMESMDRPWKPLNLFVSTADPEKEPPLVTANTILSILAVDYPVEKLACYISDDGGALLTFEAMAEAAGFADLWVPFCRKHDIEPRNPESYFSLKVDPTRNKCRPDFVKDRRKIKREYDEFKVRINGLPDSIRRRSDAFNAREEMKMLKLMRESGPDLSEPLKVQKATWMADATHWPGTWAVPASEHSKGDHAGILQVMLKPPRNEPLMGGVDDNIIDFTDVDIRLPMFVYVSREKRPGYDHNKKAGAMNALVRTSAILSNGPFILNLDCDHYIYNCKAIREGMCFMMDRGGEDICYIQFPQRFEGIDPSDRYANHNTVFFDGNMRALDGVQGPVYVGTGCMFRRFALYGFDPPQVDKIGNKTDSETETQALKSTEFDPELELNLLPKRFGNSTRLAESIPIAEYQGRPLADHSGIKYGRPPGALRVPREPLDAAIVAEAVSVISCWYEDKTEWGDRVGWIYGSVTEDVVTGYRMHNRGWRSIYCITKRDAFRGSAPINLTDRLHQVLRWATGSVEIFFSRNNALLGSQRLKFLQRMAYLNVGIYPFTSVFLIVYCFLPALSLFSGQFIVQTLNVTFLVYLLIITICLVTLAILEVKWSGVGLEEWWRNEQFWLISGTSSHLAAVVQGLLKVIAGIEISFTLTSKSGGEDIDDGYADLYLVKWTSLMIPPIVIAMLNIVGIAVAFSRTIYSSTPEWSKFVGGAFFSFWVLAHLYPFAKGLMGRRGKTPTIVFVWSGLIAITLSLLWIAISPPKGGTTQNTGGGFQFP
nr:cellulose synthase-like protein d4 [Quercus suber]